MTEHTIVVRFPEGATPTCSAGTEFQGGSVVAVHFDGNQLEVADEMEEALEGMLSIVGGVSPEEEQLVANARNVLRRRAFGT